MDLHSNKKTIMTLDAGGTNFVFSAICDGSEIVTPLNLAANGHDLNRCLENILTGFKAIRRQLKKPPSAISFAFPGPADYVNGIIGDLGNLPAFRGGVALGPMLEDYFGLPVFINNDGDLFAYGEAMHGLLPYINKKLKENENIIPLDVFQIAKGQKPGNREAAKESFRLFGKAFGMALASPLLSTTAVPPGCSGFPVRVQPMQPGC